MGVAGLDASGVAALGVEVGDPSMRVRYAAKVLGGPRTH